MSIAVRLYGMLAAHGVFDNAPIRAAFDFAYERYKLWFEAREVLATVHHIEPGTTAIDVGANIGVLTEVFAGRVGPAGRVIAIEPELANAAGLERRIARRGLTDRVHAFQGVAADQSGPMFLHVDAQHPGNHSIAKAGLVVDAITLDELSSSLRAPRISYVKIDVQGAELLVLKGMSRILGSDKPALCIEMQPESLVAFGTSVDEIVSFLAGLGYQPCTPSSGRPATLPPGAVHARLAKASYADILFLNTSKIPTDHALHENGRV